MTKFLKEPLVHFLLIGAGLFLSYGQLTETASEQQILVSAGRIQQLTSIFTKTWQRPPTPEELKGIIDEFVLEEMYYREAVEMGLDRDDTIIRRRMRQKYEFLTEEVSLLVEPRDEDLARYLDENREDFRQQSTYTFEQVYIRPDSHGDDPMPYVQEQLAALRAGATEVADASLLPASFEDARLREIDGTFGMDFSVELEDLEIGSWQGPVSSSYGFHLVYIHARTPGRLPELAEIRPIVEREWRNERRQLMKKEINGSLLEGYEVVIEWPDTDPNSSAAEATLP